MITTVCLNPCFDKTAALTQIHSGGMNRLTDVGWDCSGKGINVAIVLRRLGVSAQCAGILGQRGSDRFLEMLAKHDVPFPHIVVPGEVRTNTKVVERALGVVTELNEPGPTVSQEDWASFLALLGDVSRQSAWLALSGSLPPGLRPDAYVDCMRAAAGVPCFLDSHGEALAAGLSAHPDLVKPNLEELEALIGRRLLSLWAVREAGESLLERGAKQAIVSMGKDGAMLIQPGGAYYAKSPSVTVASSVGAGDALVGGFLAGQAKGWTVQESFRWGIACGAASVMTSGTQLIRPQDVRRLFPDVSLQEV